MVDIAQLRYLVAAAENGSFRRAAMVLQRQQSSISRSITRLEDELGVSLFERGSYGVRLTNAGKSYLEYVLPALNHLHSASKMAMSAGRGETGNVVIGTSIPPAGGFLHDVIRRFATANRDVTIDLITGSQEELVAALTSHRLDVAFITGTELIHDCETADLWSERIHVAMPKNHLLAGYEEICWQDLQGQHFIVSKILSGPECHNHILHRSMSCGCKAAIEYKSATLDALLYLVSLGQGITLVPEAWATREFRDVQMRPLSDPIDTLSFKAVWSGKNDNPALRRFISIAHVVAGRVRRGNSDWVSE